MMNVYFLNVMCLINLLRICYRNYHIATSAVLQCIMISRSRASKLCHGLGPLGRRIISQAFLPLDLRFDQNEPTYFEHINRLSHPYF